MFGQSYIQSTLRKAYSAAWNVFKSLGITVTRPLVPLLYVTTKPAALKPLIMSSYEGLDPSMTTVGRSPVKNAREPVCELLSWRLLLKGSIGNEGNYIQVVAGLDVGGADASQLTVLTVEVVIL